MIKLILLGSTPLGLATQRRGKPAADACRAWISSWVLLGVAVCVPEITDYEIRRELIRTAGTEGLDRLNTFIAARTDRYLPLTTDAMRKAAELWAKARNEGRATADPQALDGDVIVAAQTLIEAERRGLQIGEYFVATSNVEHITRYVPNADQWQNIMP